MKCISCDKESGNSLICDDCLKKLGTTSSKRIKSKSSNSQSKYVPDNLKKVIVALRRDGKRTYKSLCEEYGVSYTSIKAWEYKYWDDDTVSVTNQSNKIQVDENTNWKKIIERKDLTEEFIIENHKNLLVYTDDVKETKRDFIGRQKKVPYITISKKDNELFSVKMTSLDNIEWNKIEINGSNLTLGPDELGFIDGHLKYRIEDKIFVKETAYKKYGFTSYIDSGLTEFWVTSPKKIYRFDTERTLKHGVKNLDYVLKRNNLFYKKDQTKEFTQWLVDNNYRKK